MSFLFSLGFALAALLLARCGVMGSPINYVDVHPEKKEQAAPSPKQPEPEQESR